MYNALCVRELAFDVVVNLVCNFSVQCSMTSWCCQIKDERSSKIEEPALSIFCFVCAKRQLV